MATQAVTYGAPLVAMYNLRSTVAVGPRAKAPPNDIWRMEDISTPKFAANPATFRRTLTSFMASASPIWRPSRSFSRPELGRSLLHD